MTGRRVKKVASRESTEKFYCRKCMEFKPKGDFFGAVDKVLDSNNYLSVCKGCCEEIFNGFYGSTRNLHLSILNTCRTLNIAFTPSAVETTQKRIDKQLQSGKEASGIFGLYKKSLHNVNNVGGTKLLDVLTFVEPNRGEVEIPEVEYIFESDDDQKTFDELQYEWGKGFQPDEYNWMERRLADWKRTHKCDNEAESTLLRQIVITEFDIMKEREASAGKVADSLMKRLESLMKTAAVDPAKANQANSGSGFETLGEKIKLIEQFSPAELFGDKKNEYRDWEGIGWYGENFYDRALINYMGLSMDFKVKGNDKEEDIDDIFGFDEKEV